MRKALLFLFILLAAATTNSHAAGNGSTMFRDVIITSASGGSLTGSTGPVSVVTAKKLRWTGDMFETVIDGQTWLFNPERCDFTLPSGRRIIPVYGRDALGNERWLVGVGPDSAIDRAGVAAGIMAGEYFRNGNSRWSCVIANNGNGNLILEFPMIFNGDPDGKKKNGLHDADHLVVARASMKDGVVEVSDVTIRQRDDREQWRVERGSIISDYVVGDFMRRAAENGNGIIIENK